MVNVYLKNCVWQLNCRLKERMNKMNKVTVTKSQMDAIEVEKGEGKLSVKNILYHASINNFCDESEAINFMSEEQIVLAWHGHAEVEPEYVYFFEAFKARKEGKKVLFHINGFTYELYPNDIIEKTWANRCSLTDLVEGKWSIEVDNQ